MAKKIDYTKLFTRRKDGRWQKVYKGYTLIDKDPEALLKKVQEVDNPTEPQPPTFREIAEAWQRKHWQEITIKTIGCYNSAYKRAVDADGDRPATEITPGDINRVLLRLQSEHYSAKSIKTQKTVYKLIFNNAIIDDQYGQFIKINPAVSVTIQKGLPKTVREPPEDDAIEIIRKSHDKYFGLFPFLLLHTGLRRGEALALTWGDVDTKNKVIRCDKAITFVGGMPRIKPPKTEAGNREVLLLPDLEKLLKRPEGAKDADPIFPKETGGYLPEAAFRRRWKHYCRETGLVTDTPVKRKDKNGREYTYHIIKSALTPHQFRHGYATILFEADVDVYTAQRMLGHANVETTMAIYTHLREKQKDKSVTRLQEYMGKTYAPI